MTTYYRIGAYLAPGMKAILTEGSTFEPCHRSHGMEGGFIANVKDVLLSGEIGAVDGELEPGCMLRAITDEEKAELKEQGVT